jgi:hypothetical protein
LSEPAPWIEDRWPRDPDRVRSIVLLLHGGRPHSPATIRRRTDLTYLRIVSFARALHRRNRRRGMSVRILRYRYRGWDEPERHPVQDARGIDAASGPAPRSVDSAGRTLDGRAGGAAGS